MVSERKPEAKSYEYAYVETSLYLVNVRKP
jgi:hypothetical protein